MAMAEHSAFYLIKYIPEENVLGGCTCKVTDTFQICMVLIFWFMKKVPKMVLIPVMTWHHERRDDKEKTHLRADLEI